MRWACLQLPHLAMDTLLRQQPEPDACHVLVSGPTQRRVLHAVSPTAQKMGLARGMPLANPLKHLVGLSWK